MPHEPNPARVLLIRSDHVLYRQDSGCKLPIGIAIITGSSEALRTMPI